MIELFLQNRGQVIFVEKTIPKTIPKKFETSGQNPGIFQIHFIMLEIFLKDIFSKVTS